MSGFSHTGGGGGGGPHLLNGPDHLGLAGDAQLPATVMRGADHLAPLHQAGGAASLAAYYGRHGGPGTIYFQNAFLAWANQPAPEDYWGTGGGYAWKGDLSAMTEARFTGEVSVIGAVGSLLVLSYSDDNGATWNDVTTVPLDAVAVFDTGWIALPAPARISGALLAFRARGGNGVADPAVRRVFASVR